jgi:hypothetical protein
MRFSHAFGLALASALALFACGPGSNTGNDDDAGTGDDDAGDPPCQGLECFQVDCGGGVTTSVSGTVYAPNGWLPLPNVSVYVPNGQIGDIDPGVSCDRCETLTGNPLVQTTTDTEGRFVLEDMPATDNVPLVIQVGKWRRKITLPAVAACEDTGIADGDARLPRVQAESDPADHIPMMALTTGGADALECLLRKIGIADSNFATAGGGGRVHLYHGGPNYDTGTDQFDATLGGGAFAAATTLWDSVDDLSVYDIVFLSCEGDQNTGQKDEDARAALKSYADLGGRVFMSHWHNYWLEAGPAPWNGIATIDHDLADNDLGNVTADINTGFVGGDTLADWLVFVGGSDVRGEIDLIDTQHSITELDESVADKWIHLDDNANGVPSYQYFSFLTPVEADDNDKCGRVVFSDIHVSTGDDSESDNVFPGDPQESTATCVTDIDTMTNQEKVLAFMIFDIAACVGPIVD